MDFPDLQDTSINAVFWNNFFFGKKHFVFEPSNLIMITGHTGENQQASTWKVIRQNTRTNTKEKKEFFSST